MNPLATCILLVALFAGQCLSAETPPAKSPEPKKVTPKVRISKETTFVDGPLDKDGYIDYVAALNGRLRKKITPETNANVLLWKAFGPRPEGGRGMPPEFFDWLGIKQPPEEGEYFIDLNDYLKRRVKVEGDNEINDVLNQLNSATHGPWKAKDYPHIAGWLKANEKPLVLVVEATRRPDYYNPLTPHKTKKGSEGLLGALLPSVQKCRAVSAALEARSMLRLEEGKTDEAWQDLLACHRLARLVARGGTLIEMLVGFAIDAIVSGADLAFLDRGKLTTKQIQDCLRDLQRLPPMPSVAETVDVAERFMFLDTTQNVQRHGVGYLEGLSGGKPQEGNFLANLVFKFIVWEPAYSRGNYWFDRLAEAMRVKDQAARKDALDRFEQDVKTLKKDVETRLRQASDILKDKEPGKAMGTIMGDIMVGLMLPAANKVQQSADRAEQTQRNLHIAFALAAYQRDNGRYPEKLNALAPKYLATVPEDYFSGKPLIYRPAKDGYLLYSIGINGKDEGGRWHDDDPPGDDPRVQMPLPPLKPKK